MVNLRHFKLYEDPIKDIFLTYANESLTDNPKHFYNVINVV